MINFNGKVILITGGTQGIGLSTALTFSRYGGQCLLTYHFGSADEEDVTNRFRAINAVLPEFYQANVADPDDTKALFDKLEKKYSKIDVYVCNVAVSKLICSLNDYSFSALKKTLSYSSWPIFSYTDEIYKRFSTYPRHVVGISSTGPDHYSYGYDYVAISKKVMEVLCRYMSYRLRDELISMNIVRSRAVRTESFNSQFGKEFIAFAETFMPPDYWITPEEVAEAVVALASGYLDMMKGQIVNVDRGSHFFDCVMDLYTRRDEEQIKRLLAKVKGESS